MDPITISQTEQVIRTAYRRATAVVVITVGVAWASTTAASTTTTLATSAVRVQTVTGAITPATTTTTLALPSPPEYAARALDFIERYALKRTSVDWATIRADAERKATAAATIAYTYDIIASVLKSLGDRHSSFQRPPDAVRLSVGKVTGYGFTAVWPQLIVITVAPGSPAAVAGLVVGDRIDKVDAKAPKHANGVIAIPAAGDGEFPVKITLTVTRRNTRTQKRIVISRGEPTLISVPKANVAQSLELPGRIGYLELPGIVGTQADQDAYATGAQQAIRTIDAVARCGWVVDLRTNRGGYIYPMLAAAGPLLGDGPVAGKIDAAGVLEQWVYAAGQITIRRAAAPGSADTTMAPGANPAAVSRAASPYSLSAPDASVAVLTSSLTASAGEATTIAFRGRANTRSFGEPTQGLTTFNVMTQLPDLASIIVTNAVDTDRTGKTYDGPIPADEVVTVDWNHIGDAADPVLNAAVHWLSTQKSCAS